MVMFKEYVPATEYFPTVQEVLELENEYWKAKALRTENLDGNIFTYLKPDGMISMRLSHPDHSLKFDRVPRRVLDGNKSTQSSGEKFSQFEGDVIKLSKAKL